MIAQPKLGDRRSDRRRIVCWFSNGAASAVAAKLTLERYAAEADVVVARCVVPEEHADGERFGRDVSAWLGVPILDLRSTEYTDCEAVWRDRRYMSGTRGAPCTEQMKKAVRWAFERSWDPDEQVFGFTAEEGDRVARFRRQNPEVRLACPLLLANMTKATCHRIIAQAGIRRHEMYALGFPNANCRGCVKMDSPHGWNLTRQHFPDVFAARATLSREIGCKLVKTTAAPRVRMYLDELPPDMGMGEAIPDAECGVLCQGDLFEGWAA